VPSPVRRLVLVVLAVAACCGVAATPAVADLGDSALRAGASGADVEALQTALRAAGLTVAVDGQYGSGTTRAVKRFQRIAQLPATGVASRKTIAALLEAQQAGQAGGTSNVSVRTTKRRASLGSRIPLRRGMRGHDVRVLQDFLRKIGQRVSVDGRFGRGTARAVRRFEQQAARPVDGRVDAADIDALRALVAQGIQPVVAPAGPKATIGPDGLAVAPAGAPPAVQAIIAAGNQIASKPYKYGGGHGKWDDTGYDCSGSVSFALHGAGLLEDAMPSGSFVDWGDPGPGQWVTIYAHSGHMFMVVAGIRFDTTGRTRNNTRWQADMRSTSSYTVRHPPGL
jgi:peptidoglycan hydrolase-like protein with peptidoglycan-binding domain